MANGKAVRGLTIHKVAKNISGITWVRDGTKYYCELDVSDVVPSGATIINVGVSGVYRTCIYPFIKHTSNSIVVLMAESEINTLSNDGIVIVYTIGGGNTTTITHRGISLRWAA